MPPSDRAPGRSETAPGRVLAARRQARAVELRSLRWSFDKIAAALLPCSAHAQSRIPEERNGVPGCDACMPMYRDRSAARKACLTGLRSLYQLDDAGRDAMRAELLSTTDALLRKAVSDALLQREPDDRARAMTAAVRLMERFAKLGALDAPTRISVTDELDEELRAALADLRDTPAPDPATLRESAT